MAQLAGALEIQIFAGIARLQKDMNQAKSVVGSSMKSISSAVSMAKSALGALGIGLGVAYFGRFLKGIIDTQDELSKLSQKLNIPVEQLAGLRHAADLAGVSGEALTKGFKTLSSQMFDASMGLLESQRNFRVLGVEVKNTDGTLRDTQDVMLQVADKFAGMQDGAAKSALAVKLFGKAGLDMVPLLNEGSAAIAATIAEGQRLNPVTAESAKQAEIFNDNMSRLGKSVSTVAINIINDLLPSLSKTAKLFADAALSADGFWKSVTGWALTSGNEADAPWKAINKITESLGKQRTMLSQMENSWVSWFNADDIAILKAGIAANEAKLTYLKNLRKADPGQTDPGFIGKKSLEALGIPDEAALKKAAAAAAKAAKEALDAYNKSLENTAKNEDALTKARMEGAAVEAEAALKRGEALIAGYATVRQIEFETTLIGLSNEAREEAIALRALETSGIRKTDEAYAALAERIKSAIAEKTLAEKNKKTADEITEFWKSAAQSMQQSMSSFFFDIMQGNLKDLSGSFKRTIDRMVADVLAAKAATALFGDDFGKGGSGKEIGGWVGKMFGLFSGGGGAEAAAGAIGSTLLMPGFASGGSFMVSGSGGTDSVPVNFMATPGERVTVSTPGGKGGEQSITINMTVKTQDAQSFRRSKDQVASEIGSATQRAMARNT